MVDTLNSMYKFHGVANNPLHVICCVYKTTRLMEDIIIIYRDYYIFGH
jgi:hypothetical protein